MSSNLFNKLKHALYIFMVKYMDDSYTRREGNETDYFWTPSCFIFLIYIYFKSFDGISWWMLSLECFLTLFLYVTDSLAFRRVEKKYYTCFTSYQNISITMDYLEYSRFWTVLCSVNICDDLCTRLACCRNLSIKYCCRIFISSVN